MGVDHHHCQKVTRGNHEFLHTRRRLLFLEKDLFSIYQTMPSEALLFLFAVIMAALLLFVMVFFVSYPPPLYSSLQLTRSL